MVEDVRLYNEGGLHPVHLDDILDGRFKVVHKLGNGGFGIVWLCREISSGKWRAIKIMAAGGSTGGAEQKIYNYLQTHCSPEELEANHISVPLEQFWLEGPNGRHLCLVMPVLGWTAADWRLKLKDYEEQTGIDAKNTCRQIVEAIHFLHSHGICHGDLKPGNILMTIEGIDDLDEDQVLELMGDIELIQIEAAPGHDPQGRAPEYCVVPAQSFWSRTLATKSIAIIDFGESFFVDSPPESTGAPNLYAAPETMFPGSAPLGLQSDIWSLACTLFEVRTGGPLFAHSFGNSLSDTVKQIELFLGPLPPNYSNALSSMLRRARHTALPDAESSTQLQLSADKLDRLTKERIEFTEGSGYSDVFEAALGREQTGYRNITSAEDSGEVKYSYPRKDVVELSDLLRRMLKYDPAERLDIDAVMSHPWVGAEISQPESNGLTSIMPMIASSGIVVSIIVGAFLRCFQSSRTTPEILTT
ncbi:kinase-like protein [Hypomontagnella submonticulosa]|nr:kinase-like protein [Hypomontagnella submonticulosa]